MLEQNEFNTMGVQNKVYLDNGLEYCIFIDYDNLSTKEIRKDIQYLQEKYKLPTFYLFKTNNGHHAYCLKVIPLNELMYILLDSKDDPKHTRAIFTKHNEEAHTLRFTPRGAHRIKYVKKFQSRYSCVTYESGAHATFLKNILKADIDDAIYIGKDQLELVFYSQNKKEE